MKNDLVQTQQMNEDFSINIMGMLKAMNKGVWTKQKKYVDIVVVEINKIYKAYYTCL